MQKMLPTEVKTVRILFLGGYRQTRELDEEGLNEVVVASERRARVTPHESAQRGVTPRIGSSNDFADRERIISFFPIGVIPTPYGREFKA
jgi:hypothetical protein